MVKITGLPESGCSEVDIAKLAQPFGTPVKILLITKPSEVGTLSAINHSLSYYVA
jgi:hypothetical protein